MPDVEKVFERNVSRRAIRSGTLADMQLAGEIVRMRIRKRSDRGVDADAGRDHELLPIFNECQNGMDVRAITQVVRVKDRRQRRADRHGEARLEHLERRAELPAHFAATGIAALPQTTEMFQRGSNQRAARMAHGWLQVPSSRDDEPYSALPRTRLRKCLDQPASDRIERRLRARVP